MFALFSPGTASNYAASFRGAEPVPGFSNVKEDRFSAMLAEVPIEKYRQEMLFAREALGEYAANSRDKAQYDYYRDRDALAERQRRATALANLAGTAGAQGARLALPQRRDAYADLLGVTQAEDSLSQSRTGRMAGSLQGLAEALKGMGTLSPIEPAGSVINAASLFQAAPTYAAPQPGALAQVASTVSNMELFEQLLKQGGAK